MTLHCCLIATDNTHLYTKHNHPQTDPTSTNKTEAVESHKTATCFTFSLTEAAQKKN